MHRSLLLAVFVMLFPAPLRAQAIQPADTLLAHVRDAQGTPVPAASILITTLPARQTTTGVSDSTGTVRIAFDRTDAASLLIVIRATGFAELRRSIPIDSALRQWSFSLQRTTVAALTPVQVRANRVRPPRSMGFDGVMAPRALHEPIAGGVRGLLSPLDEANPARLAGVLPGMFDNALGAFALGADQTLVTVNGLTSDATTALPIGLATTVETNTMGTNGALGGAAGTNVNIRVAPGGTFHYSAVNVHFDGVLPTNLPRALSAAGNSVAIGVAGHGPIGNSRWRYNGAISADRASLGTNASVFASSDPQSLFALGVSSDSMTRLVTALKANGIDVAAPRHAPIRQSLSGLVRLDRVAIGGREDLRARQWSFLLRGNRTTADANVNSFSSWSTGVDGRDRSIQASARISEYIGTQQSWLHESQLMATSMATVTEPRSEVVAGHLRLLSDVDAEDVVRSVGFGGTGSTSGSNTKSRLDYQSRLARVWAGGRLESFTIDLFANAERFMTNRGQNSIGSLYFQSLEDLDRGIPIRFTRSLGTNQTRYVAGSAGAAVTAVAWPSPRTRLTSILRTEGEGLRRTIDGLHELSIMDEGRQSHTQLSVSPRLHLTWFDGGRPSVTNPLRVNPMFTALHEGATWQHGEFARSWSVALARLRGGLVNSVRATSGDPAYAMLDCIGDDVPESAIGEWFATANSVEVCADGGRGAIALPTFRTIDADFSAPSTWEASLVREQRMPGLGGSMRVSATHRITSGLPTIEDRNLDASARAVDAEGRTLLVDPSQVDTESGAVPLAASRIDETIGRNLIIRDRGQLQYTRLSIDYVPSWSLMRKLNGSLQLSYALQGGSRETDGVGILAVNDPGRLFRTGATLPRHQFSVRAARQFGPVAVSAYAFISSGHPFTPMVDQDLNGDGWANDRAMLPADAHAVKSIHELRGRVPAGVKQCLDEILRQSYGVNTCKGRWSTTTALSVFYVRPLPIGDRAVQFSAHLSNPLALLDQAIHGSSLRGWGTVPAVDTRLLAVRSFDAVAKRFAYDVNPRFGQSAPARSGNWTPFRITVSARIDMADPIPVQQLRDFVSIRQSGVRTPAPQQTIEQRIRDEYQMASPYFGVLARLDSLRLDEQQFRTVRDRDELFRAALDSMTASFARALMDSSGSGTALVHLNERQRTQYQNFYEAELALIGAILRDDQMPRISASLQRAIREAQSRAKR